MHAVCFVWPKKLNFPFNSRDLSSTLQASMTPSPSFPSQIQPNKPMTMATNIPAPQTPLNLNSSFLSGLGQISSTANRTPMNQMMISAQPTFLSTQPITQFQNGANSLATLNPIVTNQTSAMKRNGQDNAIALSAQEINDFLS